MNSVIDLKQLSIPQLRAIKAILTDGAIAMSETAKAKRLKQLEAENTQLKVMQERREIVQSAGLEWDEDYFMSFNDEHFQITVRNFVNMTKQVSLAERTCTMRIPQLPRAEELSAPKLIQQGLKNRKNGHRGTDY